MEEILHHLVVVTNSMPIVTSYQLVQDGLSIHSSPAHHSQLVHPEKPLLTNATLQSMAFHLQ